MPHLTLPIQQGACMSDFHNAKTIGRFRAAGPTPCGETLNGQHPRWKRASTPLELVDEAAN